MDYKDPLLDRDFLRELDVKKSKEIYAKIVSLNFQEEPVEAIEGTVTSGSVSIDGSSAIRRSCSLSLVAKKANINDFYWGLNHKFTLSIGIRNDINNSYPEIIWFKQGTYIITSFTSSLNTNQYNISINGQDKMCLLNGQVGGALTATVDFGRKEFLENLYELTELGQSYTIGKYYTANEEFVLSSQEYNKNTDYYKIQEFKKVDIEDTDYQPNTYYIQQPKDYYPISKTNGKGKTFKKLENPIYQAVELNVNTFSVNKYYEPKEYKKVENIPSNIEGVHFYSDSIQYQQINLDYETYVGSTYYYKENDQFILDVGLFNKSRIYYVKKDYIEDAEENSTYYATEFILTEDLIFNATKNYYIQIEYLEDSDTENDLYIYTNYVLDDNETYLASREYFSLLAEPVYEDIELTEDLYKKDTFYICQSSDFELNYDFYNSNLHYYEENNGEYKRVKFLKDNNYVAGEYYTYDPEKDQYYLSKNSYSPEVQYYIKRTYDTLSDVPIKTIIREALHTYAEEPYHNIIINDLEDYGLELMEYRGEDPLYFLMEQDYCKNVTINAKQECYLIIVPEHDFNLYLAQLNNAINYLAQGDTERIKAYQDEFLQKVTDGTIRTLEDLDYNIFIQELDEDNASRILLKDDTSFTPYTVVKIEYGEAAGYRITDLTMADSENFILNVGEPLTAMLDKICEMLTDFEYFYDIDGRFIFQRNQSRFTHSWNNIVDTETEQVESAAYASPVQYSLEGNDIINSINNNPDLNNLRNDFSVWGVRKGITGVDLPIHVRYAIDKKPTYYCAFPQTRINRDTGELQTVYETYNGIVHEVQYVYYSNEAYNQGEFPAEEYLLDTNKGIHKIYVYCDWREIIYQMAMDWYKHNQENDFEVKIMRYNGDLYPEGSTGYEKYYIDIEGFWRGSEFEIGLYNPTPEMSYTDNKGSYKTYRTYNAYSQELASSWNEDDNLYTDLVCDYYLPLSEKEKYEKLIDEQQQAIKDKIEKTTIYYENEVKESGIEKLKAKQDEIVAEIQKNQNYINELKNVNRTNLDLVNNNVISKENLELYLERLNNYKTDLEKLKENFITDASTTIYDILVKDITDFSDLSALESKVQADLAEAGILIEEFTEQKEQQNELTEELNAQNAEENIEKTEEQTEEINNLQEDVSTITDGITNYINAQDNEIYKFYMLMEQFKENYAKICSEIEALQEDIKLQSENVSNNETNVTTDQNITTELSQEYLDKIKALQKENRQYTTEINKINSELSIIENDLNILKSQLASIEENKEEFLESSFSDKYMYWNKSIIESPQTLNFWLEFLDTDGEISKYAVNKVGDRTKAINDTNITSIYFREVPTVIFTTEQEYDPVKIKTGYTYIFYPEGTEDLFTLSYRGKSAKEMVDELMYNFAYCIENLNIQAIPIYYLEPNNRIFIHNEEANIDGEYLIKRITLPLTHNGMMSMEATKAPIRLY